MKCTGWLSPSGELVSCDGYAHLDKATQITKDLGVFDENKHSDEVLQRLGWIRISKYTYSNIGLTFLNPYLSIISIYQKMFLHQIYESIPNEISEDGWEQLNTWGVIDEDTSWDS